MKTLRSPFKTARGEAEYLAAYERSMRRWPVPYASLELESRFGRTHVVVSGPATAPPLLLLHGYGISSTMWSPNIADLARHHRVYAVDVVGQAGRSVPDEPMASRADCVEWMTSVLDALELERARVVGMSYGAWLTLNYALAAPQRLDKIVLLSPAAGFVPLVKQFFVRGIVSALLPWRFVSDALFLRWITFKGNLLDASNRELNELLGEQLHLGAKHLRGDYARTLPPPTVFSDDELRGLRVPTLLLIGEQEVLYDPVEALRRARRLIPHLQGELITGASHDLSYDRHDIVDARVLAFLLSAPDRRTAASRQPAATDGPPAVVH